MHEEQTAGALVLVFVAALLIAVVLYGSGAFDKAGPGASGAGPAAVDQRALDEFWQRVTEHQPKVETITYACPVDGAPLAVPSIIEDNRLGGVASDMMELALAPPVGGIGPPDLTKQRFNIDLATCPKCGATFAEVDLPSVGREEAKEALKAWDLAKLAAPLAAIPAVQWSADERALAHYLTLRQAGLSPVELGIAALDGAYCCNLAVALGQKRRLPAPAFYALAAACFADGLQRDETRDARSASFCALMLGETSRLLGRQAQAQAAFAKARKLGGLDDASLHVLGQLEGHLAAGRFSLERVELPRVATPPLGWYLDLMLPAMNGDIAAYRGEWAGLTEQDAIVARILAALKQQ